MKHTEYSITYELCDLAGVIWSKREYLLDRQPVLA